MRPLERGFTLTVTREMAPLYVVGRGESVSYCSKGSGVRIKFRMNKEKFEKNVKEFCEKWKTIDYEEPHAVIYDYQGFTGDYDYHLYTGVLHGGLGEMMNDLSHALQVPIC